MRAIQIGVMSVVFAMISTATFGEEEGIHFGKQEYLRSCASCHGVSGKGDGPVAKSLSRPPADLTKLTENNRGVFPVSRVYDVIDGRVQVAIHGTREMPVWGEIYTRDVRTRAPHAMPDEMVNAMVRIKILGLIEYISTLQGK
jgi:mono/diheme cytochrome c family protein